MNTRFNKKLSTVLLGAAISAAAGSASAYNLIDEEGTELNLDVLGLFGTFSSEEGYGGTPDDRTWQEGSLTLGLSGSKAVNEDFSVYGGINTVTTFVGGDGEAGGSSSGDENTKTTIDDAYVGIRKGIVDFSVGSQGFQVGDGFLLWDDGLNFGDFGGAAPELNRGGTYYLGGGSRKAFDKTAILRIGEDQGVRSDIFWLESDNPGQASTELAGINLEYNAEVGTFAALYIKGLGVDSSGALGGLFDNTHRDGQDTFSVRYQGNAGVENLFLSSEFVTQNQGDSTVVDADAWYVEAGWTFADAAWAPMVSYRYSSFDEGFDPLFYGFSRGYSTWYQGEVAGNYAGPFNSDADVHHLSVVANPSETLRVGAHYLKFTDTVAGSGDNDADEINLWAEWVAHDNLIISPLVSFYTPDSASSTQGSDDTNTYFQLVAIVPF